MTWEEAALGVDVSHWQPEVDWAALRAGGVTFAVLKATQGTALRDTCFIPHLEGARAAGLRVGAYHWCDPIRPAIPQADHFLRTIRGQPLDFLALDVEQHWASWREWEQRHVMRLLSPARISQVAQAIAQRVRAATGLPVLIYTRVSFIAEFARPMLTWLGAWPLWLAQYPYPRGRITCTWEALRAHFLPTTARPVLPPGCATWQMWQFSAGRFILPGVPAPLDLNLFNGTPQAFEAWLAQVRAGGTA